MKKLKVASYNIHKCVGIDKKFSSSRIINVIKELDVDILALQETDKRFGKRIGLLDLELLKNETNFSSVPIQTMTMHGHGWHGNAIFIKHEQIRQTNVLDILQINLPGVESRGALIVELMFPFGPLRIVATHFGLLAHSRFLQSKTIVSCLKERKFMPTILLGDFNEWRSHEKSSLAPIYRYFSPSVKNPPSFPTRRPFFPLDRIFCNPSNWIKSIEAHNTPLSRIASDHLPLKATFLLTE